MTILGDEIPSKAFNYGVNCHQIKLRPNSALIFTVTATSEGLFAPLEGCICSVSDGSGPSFRDRVWVGTEPLPNWLSGLSIDRNCQFGYSSMEILNLSELGGLSAGCPAGPFVDSYNALVFAA